MVKVELSDRLELIKHQIKIIQAKDDNDEVDQLVGLNGRPIGSRKACFPFL